MRERGHVNVTTVDAVANLSILRLRLVPKDQSQASVQMLSSLQKNSAEPDTDVPTLPSTLINLL